MGKESAQPRSSRSSGTGREPDGDPSATSGARTPVVRKGPPSAFTWTEEHLALLGKLPDREVAAQLGRTRRAVAHMRLRTGIPPVPATRADAWRAEEIELLGTAPDSEIAARIGRSRGAVEMKRLSLGIHRGKPPRCCTALCVKEDLQENAQDPVKSSDDLA